MIEVLAVQIYPTPFALLRENVQNSYDAILQRRHMGQEFEARIDVTIASERVCVTDNGIGMSREGLRSHFWRAGSSSKNTEEARAAGVVGTFGIGAMANFGIAEELHVETEDVHTRERTAWQRSALPCQLLRTASALSRRLPRETRERESRQSCNRIIPSGLSRPKHLSRSSSHFYQSMSMARRQAVIPLPNPYRPCRIGRGLWRSRGANWPTVSKRISIWSAR